MGYISGEQKITRPFNTWSVALCLGVNSGDVATLCQHKNIRARSAFKPIRRFKYRDSSGKIQNIASDVDNYPQEMQEDDFVVNNYGIKMNTTFNSINNLVNAVVNSLPDSFEPAEGKTDWAFYYERPKAGDMCRILDFDGYVHLAGDWISIEFDNHGAGNNAEQQTNMVMSFNYPFSKLSDIQAWGVAGDFFDGNGNFTGKLGLVVCQKTTNEQRPYEPKYFTMLIGGEDFTQTESALQRFIFTPSIAGTYYIYPIITNATRTTEGVSFVSTGDDDKMGLTVEANTMPTDARYLALPYSSFVEWKPVASGTPEGGKPSASEFITWDLDTKDGNGYRLVSPDRYVYRVESFDLVLTIGQERETDTVVNGVIYAGTEAKGVIKLMDYQVVIPAGERSVPLSYQRPEKDEENKYNFIIEDGNPYLKVYYNTTGYITSKAEFELNV